MDEPDRVRRHDGLQRLLREAVKIAELQRPSRQHLLERLALDQFHHHESALGADAVIEDRDDVGMLQRSGGHHLAPRLLQQRAFVLGALGLHPHAL